MSRVIPLGDENSYAKEMRMRLLSFTVRKPVTCNICWTGDMPAILVDKYGVDHEVAKQVHNVWANKCIPIGLCDPIQLTHTPANAAGVVKLLFLERRQPLFPLTLEGRPPVHNKRMAGRTHWRLEGL